MPPIDYAKPAFGFVPLLAAEWDGGAAYYARQRESITIADQVYEAMPEMELEFPSISGGLDDNPVRLTVPDSAHPFDKMIVSAFPEVKIRVLEGDYENPNDEPLIQWTGIIQKTLARYKGKTRLMQLTVVGRKFFLRDVSLGLKATDRCPWFFGDRNCQAEVASTPASVSALDGTKINFWSLPNDTAKGGWTQGRYTRGFVEKDGLRILIREHRIGSAEFILAKAPPQSSGWTWEGELVTVYEGCDKSIAACEAHGQQLRFGGIGINMPKHNPIIEDGGFS